MKQKDNPLRNLKFTMDVAYALAAFTGAGVVFAIALGNLKDTILPYWVCVIISLLICAAVLYVIDYGLKKELPFGITQIISGKAFKNWKSIAFTVILFSILGLRIFTSASLSWSCRVDAAEAIVAKPEQQDALAASEKQSAAMAAALSPIQSDIDKLNKQIRASEKAAYNSAPQSSKDMIKSGKDKWGWHRKHIASLQSSASAPYRNKLAAAEKLKAETLATFNANTTAIITGINTSNKTNLENYEYKVSRNQDYYGYFAVGCLLFAISIQILLKLAPSETKKKKKKKPLVSETQTIETPKVSNIETKPVQQIDTPSVSEPHQVKGFEIGNTIALSVPKVSKKVKPVAKVSIPQVSKSVVLNTETETVSEINDFSFSIQGNTVQVEGFTGWYDAAGCRKKIQQYQAKNAKGIGRTETNNNNIKKFQSALLALNEEPINL